MSHKDPNSGSTKANDTTFLPPSSLVKAQKPSRRNGSYSDKNPAASSEKGEPVLVSVKGVAQLSHLPALSSLQCKGAISLLRKYTDWHRFNKTCPGGKDRCFPNEIQIQLS